MTLGTVGRTSWCVSARSSVWPNRGDAFPLHQWSHMLIRLEDDTNVRISKATHRELERIATEMDGTVGEAVALAVRTLRQRRIGEDLSSPLTKAEIDWLDAHFG